MNRFIYLNSRFLLLILLVILTLASASQAKKLALIVGNSNYQIIGGLKNPANDVAAYAVAFSKLGFEVEQKLDLDLDSFADALEIFSNKAEAGDTIAFVYSGHGWSDGKSNFLVPIDAPIEGSDRKLRRSTIELRNGRDGVLDIMEETGASLVFSVIDACRDSPFVKDKYTKSSALSRGLGWIEPPAGTYVVFSAGEGQKALDSLPDDDPDIGLSLFARHFVPLLESRTDLRKAVLNARELTARDAKTYDGHLQVPAIYDQVIDARICLGGECLEAQTSGTNTEQLSLLSSALVLTNLKERLKALNDFSINHPTSALGREAKKHIKQTALQIYALKLNKLSSETKDKPTTKLPTFPEIIAMRIRLDALKLNKPSSQTQDKLTTQLPMFSEGPELLNDNYNLKSLSKRMSQLLEKAKNGDKVAMAYIGLAYFEGEIIDQNYLEATKWYTRAAQIGEVNSQYALGLMYGRGQGGLKDFNLAAGWYTSAAKQGHVQSQYLLGSMYETGLGVPQDDRAAVKWYTLAAEQGQADAQHLLGVMYQAGKGVPHDYKKSAKWYTLAAEQGHAKAQHLLGVMYQVGLGVPQDYRAAVKWYTLAAEQGQADAQYNLADAQYNLGVKYERGLGVPTDYKIAVKWYTLAAEKGNPNAQNDLGMVYQTGLGVPMDDKTAVKWYTLAAEQDYSDAKFNLGWMYDNGYGVPMDDKTAVKWYTLAAEQGHANAQYRLGGMYEGGYGVPKNDKTAVKWYTLAAEQRIANAQNEL